MRSEIRELKTSAKTFQKQRCDHCNGQLDLPAIHFLCGHSESFHKSCVDNEETADPQRK